MIKRSLKRFSEKQYGTEVFSPLVLKCLDADFKQHIKMQRILTEQEKTLKNVRPLAQSKSVRARVMLLRGLAYASCFQCVCVCLFVCLCVSVHVYILVSARIQGE